MTKGATERLVPILMTALAAGLALVPIAMSMGEAGSEIQAPMAMVTLCGLASSTVLNMVVVPVLYAHFGRPVAANQPGSADIKTNKPSICPSAYPTGIFAAKMPRMFLLVTLFLMPLSLLQIGWRLL